jgi:hypothetical protein
LIFNGSRNTPLSKQDEYDEVSLMDDPSSNTPFFDFNFDLPEIEIPFISGIFGLAGEGLWFIFFIILVMILLLIISLYISHVQKGKKKEIKEKATIDKPDQKEMKIRRMKLGQRIEEIIQYLKSCQDGQFSQGITIGFERLDNAFKEYSKISRPGWLTPREFSHLKIPYFNHEAMNNAVEKFYRITYGQKEAHRIDLEDFIHYLEIAIADKRVLEWYSDIPMEGSK